MSLITPQWPAPENVRAFVSTRLPGLAAADLQDASPSTLEAHVSPYADFNLAQHVGDQPARVDSNRQTLSHMLGIDQPNIHWLNQTHSTTIYPIVDSSAELSSRPKSADGSSTQLMGQVCVVLTADCLPVLICDKFGTQVAAIHAGWRGLANGILSKTIAGFHASPESLLCYLGPAISQSAFQVGEDVLDAFNGAASQRCYAEDVSKSFVGDPSTGGKKYLADLYRIARAELNGLGVSGVFGGAFCTYSDSAQFYSYRRNSVTGRMATGIWLQSP